MKKPNITKAWTHHLWYENDKGKRFPVTERELRTFCGPSVSKHPYSCSCFPLGVTTKCYRRRQDGGYGAEDLVYESHSSAPGDLAVAIVVKSNYKISLDKALLIASQACERCMNILAHGYGLSWGYAANSAEAKKCGTSCDLCT